MKNAYTKKIEYKKYSLLLSIIVNRVKTPQTTGMHILSLLITPTKEEEMVTSKMAVLVIMMMIQKV